MERPCMMILFLAVGLLLVFRGLIFAEESAAAAPTVRYQLAKVARTFVGLPHRWGEMSERRGVDCSGLVKMLFARLHIELPRSSREQIQAGERVAAEDMEIGDLVFFSSGGRVPTHVGIYIGNDRFLHASKGPGESLSPI